VFRNCLLLTTLFAGLFNFQCYFKEIKQPTGAQVGDTITVKLTIQEETAETTNAHKGLLGILLPEDWSFIAGSYSSSVGNGILEESAAWTDSANFYYPTAEYGENMNWLCLLSDTGFIYSDLPAAEISLRLRVGESEGCFNLAYLATKATKGLLGTGWTAFSYPHPIGVPDSGVCVFDDTLDWSTERSLEWEELFDRRDGWTGADGIYSIPLNGSECYTGSDSAKTLFLFSDTFIGSVSDDGLRIGAKMVHNTLGLLRGDLPLAENLEFTWGETDDGAPAAVFIPDMLQSNSDAWFWLMDGIAINDTIYVYGMRLRSANDSWEVLGVSLISFTLENGLNVENIKQADTPLLAKSADGKQIIIGQAIMPMTAASGNPGADGYIYVYGPMSGLGTREMVASRFLPEDIRNFSQYSYWDGNNWVADITQVKEITGNISMEFSVSPLENGKFITVFQLNTVSHNVAVSIGDSPVGPFGYYKVIWNCPEADENSNIFMYNAKAHPHLSGPGELLISYNVNAYNWDAFTYADIYRPRFIVLDLKEFENDIDLQENNEPAVFALSQNYPNPFNGLTTIAYKINLPVTVQLSVYDLSGRLVRELFEGFAQPGYYHQTWDGKDKNGREIASGIYCCQLSLNVTGGESLRESRKMVYMK